MVYSHKWSSISCKSSAGQGKFAGDKRPAFYLCATQPTTQGITEIIVDLGSNRPSFAPPCTSSRRVELSYLINRSHCYWYFIIHSNQVLQFETLDLEYVCFMVSLDEYFHLMSDGSVFVFSCSSSVVLLLPVSYGN